MAAVAITSAACLPSTVTLIAYVILTAVCCGASLSV